MLLTQMQDQPQKYISGEGTKQIIQSKSTKMFVLNISC